MRASHPLNVHREQVRAIARRHRATAVRVFGSVARGDDSEGSDVDLIVDMSAGATLFDVGAIQHEVSELLGIDVDVLTPGALPDRHRERILADAQPL